MAEQSEGAQKKAAAKSSASLVAGRDKAAAARAEATVNAQLAEQDQHDAKVALQNARFAELGESLAVDTALTDLGVTVRK